MRETMGSAAHSEQGGFNRLEGANAHVEEQWEQLAKRIIHVPIYEWHAFICILSVHIGDVNGTVESVVAEALVDYFQDVGGTCTMHCGKFRRPGVGQEHTSRGTYAFACLYRWG